MDNKKIIALLERVARRIGVKPARVHLTFHMFAEEDGGPAWGVNVSRMEGRTEMKLFAAGTTIAEAERELYNKAALRGVLLADRSPS